MNWFIKTLLYFLLLAATSHSNAQTSAQNLDTLAGRFIQQLRQDTKEKIFVQTNKWFYTAGEELWLKAYIINALSHKYYSHSKTLYVDLVDDKDTAITQLLLNIPQQQTEGVIPLSISLPEGYYWLRIYTANMLQHDTSSIFVLPIYIINKRFPPKLSEEAKSTVAVTTNKKPRLIFFPEGGALIENSDAIIGFKATDQDGNPMEVSGTITDIYNKEVTTFKADSSGLGKFNYHVFKSRKCAANIKWNGQDLSWPLPAVSHTGSQLSVIEEDASNLKVLVLMGDSVYKKDKPSYILGVSRDSLCFASTGEGMYEVYIPKKNFPAGKATLYLFNNQQEIISERVIYINKERELAEIKTDKENYKNRDKVTLTINTGDSLSGPEIAALSVSVTDDNLANQPIGLPDNPYNQLEITTKLSDNDLLTQPQLYTGKNFKNTFAPVAVQKSFDFDSTVSDIKGRILNNKNQPIPNRTVTLYSTKQISLFTSTTTDSSGHFKFPLVSYPDSTVFTIQVTDKKGIKQNDKIIVEAFPFPKFATPLSLKKKLSLPQKKQVQIFREKHVDDYIVGTGKEWLKEVTVIGKRKKVTTYDNNKRLSLFSHVLTGDAIQKMGGNNATAAVLTIPGIHLRSGRVNIGGPTSMGGSAEPLLIIDGVEHASDTAVYMDSEPSSLLLYLSTIPADIIDFIEVLKGPEAAIYGTRGGNGVIIVNTLSRSNIHTGYESVGILKYSPRSYHRPTEFSMPDYDDKRIKNTAFNDSRPTLYWNGHLYTDAKGKAVLSFFTSDVASNYTVTVSGITADGDIIYKKTAFRRK